MAEYKLDMARYDQEAEAQAKEASRGLDHIPTRNLNNPDDAERWAEEARHEREDAIRRVEQSDEFITWKANIDSFSGSQDNWGSVTETASKTPEYPMPSYLVDWWLEKMSNPNNSPLEKFGYFAAVGVPMVAFPPLIAIPVIDILIATPLAYLFKRLTN